MLALAPLPASLPVTRGHGRGGSRALGGQTLLLSRHLFFNFYFCFYFYLFLIYYYLGVTALPSGPQTSAPLQPPLTPRDIPLEFRYSPGIPCFAAGESPGQKDSEQAEPLSAGKYPNINNCILAPWFWRAEALGGVNHSSLLNFSITKKVEYFHYFPGYSHNYCWTR